MDSEDTVILTRATTAGIPEPGARAVIPRSLGSVRLVRQIGQGGMGAVWLGRHEMLGRDVAVKFLLNVVSSQQDPQFAQFIEGAKAAGAISHPGLNAILHADVASGVPYLVMEYIDGPALSALLRTCGPLPPAAAAAVIGAVCEPIAVLHDHGVIHRDIKPGNILVSSDARVVVTDFGLSCFRSLGDGGESEARAVSGTPQYMAPEMFDGAISPRSDVYALGVTAYEVLAGRRPFDGTPASVEKAQREMPLPREPLLARGVPESVCEVLERATSKNIVFRYKSARHFAHGLAESLGAGTRPRNLDDVLSRLLAGQKLGGETAGSGHTPQQAAVGTPGGGTTGAYYERISTLADVKRRFTPPAVDVEPGSAPSGRCRRCGYPVAAQHEGPCPECGLLATDPASASPGMTADPDAAVPTVAPAPAHRVGAAAAEPEETRRRGSVFPPALGRWCLAWVVGAAVATAAAIGMEWIIDLVVPDAAKTEAGQTGGWMALITGTLLIVMGMPAFVLGCFVFARLAPPRPRDGVTRCGHCGHGLIGLREPRCSECGRAI